MTVRAVKSAPIVEVVVPPVLRPPIWFAAADPDLDRQDCIGGLLGRGGLSSVYGGSGTGKTFFVLDMALAVARGVEWNGRRVERGIVLYAAGEGQASVRARLAAYRRHHFGDARPEIPFALIPQSINLLEPELYVPAVVELAKQSQSDWELPLALIVIDTLARSMAGADENSGQDMGRAVQAADRLRTETGAHVNLVHHTGKAENGARGHSSLKAALDTEIEVSANGAQRVAKVTKQRDLAVGDSFGFMLKSIPIGRNPSTEEMVFSCVVDHMGDAPAILTKPTGKAQKHLLAEIERQATLPGALATWTEENLREIGRSIGLHKNTARDAVLGLRQLGYFRPSVGGTSLVFTPGPKDRNRTENTGFVPPGTDRRTERSLDLGLSSRVTESDAGAPA